jgi:hypothetical protein
MFPGFDSRGWDPDQHISPVACWPRKKSSLRSMERDGTTLVFSSACTIQRCLGRWLEK